jgi:putative spermidine/putrescine transport system permease protein
MASRRRPGASGVIALLAVAGCAMVPLAILAIASVARDWYWPALLPGEWTTRAWRYAASGSGGIGPALVTSLALAVVVAVVAVAVALPAARALALHRFPGRRLFVAGLLLPMLAPPLAAAMGLHAVFLRAGLADSVAGVALVHLIPAVPYATLLLTGTFAGFDTDLEAQARTLGANRWSVWTRITLPAIAPGMAVAAILAFLVSWSQYVLTLLIGGGRVLTLPLLLVAFQRGGDEAVASALSILFVAPALVLFALATPLLEDA